MASDQASGITGTTVNLTMGSLDDLLLRSPLGLTVRELIQYAALRRAFPDLCLSCMASFRFYRGVYEWDGPDLAEAYARALWGVPVPVSTPGSIHDQVARLSSAATRCLPSRTC